MKKIISLILTVVFLVVFSATVFANEIEAEQVVISQEAITETTEEATEETETSQEVTSEPVVAESVVSHAPSYIVAINKDIIIANGTKAKITAPVLAFGKTYVDLHSMASYLGYNIEWVEAYIGYFKVSKNDKVIDFTLISNWEELTNRKYKFFVKNSKIYVSLRELNEFAGLDIAYDNGIITLGNQTVFDKSVFGDVNEYSSEDHIYVTYQLGAEYVVNPYQKYGYDVMMNDAKKLQRLYPDLIKTSSIGKSVEGRDLLLLEFGRGKNKIFVCGTHHAREYITTTYLMYTIDRYAYSYRTNTMWGSYSPKDILNNVTFCIVPMVNPDGVNLVHNGIYATKNPEEIAGMGIYDGLKYGYSSWKANVRGVDLNWNYDKDWSIEKNKNPRGSSGFNGDTPYTEPETIAVSNYVDSIEFDAFLSMHTQGQIFYWADSKSNPMYIQDIIRRDTGFVGYREEATGIGGSFFDYVYRKFDKPTITVELCPYIGNYPYPDKNFDYIWRPAKNVMLIMANEVIYNKSLVK